MTVTVTSPAVLDVPAVAELLHCSRAAVYRRLERGEIPGSKPVGHRWLVRLDAVLAWLRTQEPQADRIIP